MGLVCELVMLLRMSLLVWRKKVRSDTNASVPKNSLPLVCHSKPSTSMHAVRTASVPGNHHSNRLPHESSKKGLLTHKRIRKKRTKSRIHTLEVEY